MLVCLGTDTCTCVLHVCMCVHMHTFKICTTHNCALVHECVCMCVCVYTHVPCMDMSVCAMYTQSDYLVPTHTSFLALQQEPLCPISRVMMVAAVAVQMVGAQKWEGGSVTGKTLTNEATCLASQEDT